MLGAQMLGVVHEACDRDPVNYGADLDVMVDAAIGTAAAEIGMEPGCWWMWAGEAKVAHAACLWAAHDARFPDAVPAKEQWRELLASDEGRELLALLEKLGPDVLSH